MQRNVREAIHFTVHGEWKQEDEDNRANWRPASERETYICG